MYIGFYGRQIFKMHTCVRNSLSQFHTSSKRIIYVYTFNTASTQDTANNHTNQMGDFFAPMCFGRVLPPTTAHIVWGSVDPPMEGYGIIIP